MRYTVVHDFTGKEEGELTVRQGTLVDSIDESSGEDGWIEVIIEGQQGGKGRGFVPLNYLKMVSSQAPSSPAQDYSLLLLKKSREVERLNDALVVQEALASTSTDDLLELFGETLKFGRAVRIIGNQTLHKLQLVLKELETLEKVAKSDNTTKNVTAELETLNDLQQKDARHRAAVLIQTFFRGKKIYYDECVNRIARFWRLYR